MKKFLQVQWKIIAIFNLVSGSFLCFSTFTNVSFRGTIPDLLLPPGFFALGIITFFILPKGARLIGRLLCLPSLISGLMYILTGIMMVIPPFTLGLIFGADEIANEVQIQQIASPNQIDFAEVIFRPVGAYTGGSGRIYVHVVNKYFPIIEREIYTGKTRTADQKTTNYVKWVDENTLYISEIDQEIASNNISHKLPLIAIIPMMIGSFTQSIVKENQLTAPLNDIPIYPAQREHESNNYYDIKKTSERIYFLPQAKIREIYNWHLSKLSAQPWKITDSQIVPDTDPAYQEKNTDIYCITAEKHDNDKTTVYYFEIRELHQLLEPDYNSINPNLWDVRVIVSTPNPDSIHCWLK